MTSNQPHLFDSEALPRRKAPQQPRSHQTVARIKRAMLELIAEEGYAVASTNRIAQRARVNIASLYQYFPNRQAIALALYESASSELAQRVHQTLLTAMPLPLDQGICALVKVVVAIMERDRAILIHLADEVPELRETAQTMSLENLARHTSGAFLEHHFGKMDAGTLNCKLYFVQSMSMSVIRRYVLDRPRGISKSKFVSELSTLLAGYLKSA